MFEINEGLFLVDGDLKAYGGSKHGQVLRQIELSDWHGQSFGGEYSFLRLQKFVIVGERKVKLLHVVLVPKGYVFEEGAENFNDISRESSTAMAMIKKSLIEAKSI